MPIFRTIGHLSTGEYQEKGSRFLAFATNIETEEDFKTFIHSLRKEHFKAHHVCYAYRINPLKTVERWGDDGEPSNTAGIPILNQIRKYELKNVCVAVVRYFGGVLLGKGGLIRAYSKAAENAILNGDIILSETCLTIKLKTGNENLYRVIEVVKKFNGKIQKQLSGEKCSLYAVIPSDSLMHLRDQLKDFTEIQIEENQQI